MEFPTNGNLQNKIQFAIDNKMYMEECIIWNILTQILQGLNYAHNNGVIHKNLNSKNIYLSKFRLAKIINFGETTSLNNLGNLFYNAPEILIQKQYSHSCDIWSLGCIIYEMATLYLPFYGDNIESLYNNIIFNKYKPIPDFYSNNLKSIIKNMLMIDPSKRPLIHILLDYPIIKETRNQLNQIYSLYINYNNKNIRNNLKSIKTKKNASFKNIQKNILNENIKRKSRTMNNSRNVSKSNFDNCNKNNTKIDIKKRVKKINNSTYRTLKERNLYFQKSIGSVDKKRCNSRNYYNSDIYDNKVNYN